MASHYITEDLEMVKKMNPDDRLSMWDIIMKYQLQFTKNFGPKYAYGVTEVEYTNRDDNERIIATARVRPAHQATRGETYIFEVPYSKFLIWRKNIKLYDFIKGKQWMS